MGIYPRGSDGTYYTGCTTHLDQRINEHKEGKYDGYTSRCLPVKLIWETEFRDINRAIDVERQIKGWSRKKKQALMDNDFDLLHVLAQSKKMKERRRKHE